MAKPKQAVVELEEEEVKAEGLEIISIGSLYNGSWEKKYWSSSRGKDRYPYPVGYHAVRAHNGSTCKVEIHDGPKGPLFVITSADGHSCSGQTPDMAWEKFQKKHCPRTKTWHGKRLSCKIDGVEFFGFKNSFVQRLLRELVANVNGTAEKTLLSSSFCNEVSSTKHDNQHPDTCIYSDLQAHLEKPKITKKRSRRSEITNTKQIDRNVSKKPRSQEQENNFHEHQGSMQASVYLKSKTVEEKDGNLQSKDGFPLDFDLEESKFAGSEICNSIKLVNNIAEEGKPPDRSKNFSFLGVAKDEARGAQVSRDSPGVENVDLCAPDTLDFVQVSADNTSCSSPGILDKSTNNLKEDSATANIVISENMVTDSHIEEEIGTSTSNASSEKTELDSLGQEITKAMMTVLLPQAIPLLNKVSRKKEATVNRASEALFCGVDQKEENKKTSHSVEASFPAAMIIEKTNGEMDGKMQSQNINLSTVVPSSEHSKSVIPDSYEDDLCGDYTTKQLTYMVEADQSSVDKDANLSDTRKELDVLDVRNESSVCHVETDRSKHTLCHDEECMISDKKLQEDRVCISESGLSCRSAGTKVLSDKLKDVCAKLDQNSVGSVHLLQKDLKALDCSCTEDGNDANQRGMSSSVQILWKDVPAKTAAAETSSSARQPNKVYSRKTVLKPVPSAEKLKGPLSENIICRNFGDNLVPKTHCATETMVASKTSQMSSGDKPQKGFCDAEARIVGQSHGLPVISQNSTVFCDPGGKDGHNSNDPCILQIEKSELWSDKELVGQMNLAEFNCSVSSQKQNTKICEYSICTAKKLNSDSKLQKQMELRSQLGGTVELVGCYIHPLPVSSVKLSTIGNEIYVCVSCGLLVDKNRTLFIYKLAIQEPRVGCPSFVGHTSVILPYSKDDFGRDIALESSCLLFTPDGQSLVLLESMKTPYCREGRVDCLCSTCTSNRFEENALKIVQVKPGYVALVAKLKTVDSVQCILVCEPNHLVAIGGSGKLHLWEMNSTWSAHMTEFVIPVNDLIYPCIVELKRIVKCAPLVVGHNGFGEFGVWDISRRVFLSRFSAPSTSTYQFFPISIFSWQRHGSAFMDADVQEHINGIMDATKRSFLEHNENNIFLPSKEEDIAIWLVVQSVSESDAQHDYTSSDHEINPVRLWRLALLVKNMVIMGSPLDPRAAAINTSAGHGIIGTHDGLVYLWEFSTGIKLGTLHDFKGGTITCIATDDSRPRVLAVASDGRQLLVYLHGQNNFADHLGGNR